MGSTNSPRLNFKRPCKHCKGIRVLGGFGVVGPGFIGPILVLSFWVNIPFAGVRGIAWGFCGVIRIPEDEGASYLATASQGIWGYR